MYLNILGSPVYPESVGIESRASENRHIWPVSLPNMITILIGGWSVSPIDAHKYRHSVPTWNVRGTLVEHSGRSGGG